jgi:hypothetical protein
MKKIIAAGTTALFSLALLLLGVFGVFSANSSASTNTSTSVTQHQPTNLDGSWKMAKSGIPGAVMTATIRNKTIRIDVTMSNDVSGLYWTGTFDTGGDNLSPFSVTSTGDTAAMAEAMFGSGDSTKVFYYNNGVLSFPFSMMGVSTTVELSRS